MRTCARRWGSGAPSFRSGILLLLIPPLLLGLQLLVVGPRLPRAAQPGEGEGEGAVAFSVISIEPDRNSRYRGSPSRPPGPGGEDQEQEVEVEEEDEEGREGERAYEDENEMLSRQVGPRTLDLQPWAAEKPSFMSELDRIITYIARPQLNCSRVLSPGQTPAGSQNWLLCAEDWLIPAADASCVAYSFSMDAGDAEFLKTVSALGCEVHCFNPSNSDASGRHLGNSLEANHRNGGGVSRHKMWLEWRVARKRMHMTRGGPGSVSQTLADIMAALGHHTVHFLYADLLSAEWRVFQNWIELGTLQSVHHLVATVHLQWAGFEVGGTDEEVIRYWFSVLQSLRASGLKLIHSSAGDGHRVLKQTVEDAHSSYMLSWVNTRR